jgi:hypothetical protein
MATKTCKQCDVRYHISNFAPASSTCIPCNGTKPITRAYVPEEPDPEAEEFARRVGEISTSAYIRESAMHNSINQMFERHKNKGESVS